jgi:4-hydroxy-2-oxoheptanedioate aldolase
MPAPVNGFKAALSSSETQIGLWLGLANAYTAEICAGAGFDWLLIDGEHAPNDLPLIAAQLQAIAASGVQPVVRPPIGEAWVLKQLLDIGAQTILVPMVETATQAKELVRAVTYPPSGIRGVGAALARASAFNRTPDYLATANEQVCLLVQLESVAALAALEEIAAIDGVHGVFIGPSDLAADMGYLGRPGEAAVQAAVEDGLERIIRAGKPAGILTSDRALAARYIELGATFVAVGTDVALLAQSSSALANAFKGQGDKPASTTSGY